MCVSGKRSGFDADDEDHERVPKILVEDVNFGLKKTTITPKASVPVSDEWWMVEEELEIKVGFFKL